MNNETEWVGKIPSSLQLESISDMIIITVRTQWSKSPQAWYSLQSTLEQHYEEYLLGLSHLAPQKTKTVSNLSYLWSCELKITPKKSVIIHIIGTIFTIILPLSPISLFWSSSLSSPAIAPASWLLFLLCCFGDPGWLIHILIRDPQLTSSLSFTKALSPQCSWPGRWLLTWS